jgi:methyl-galactoside transport system ATP-binding protein
MYEETRAIFQDLQIDVDPRTRIGALSVSRRQMVEIAKAVSYNAKILVLDEPTSSLTENEVEHLFRIMKRLTEKGVGIIYISHKMDEILRIADDVTIMRDGQWVATRPARELDTDEIIRLMVNRDMSHRFPPKTNQPGKGADGGQEPFRQVRAHVSRRQLYAARGRGAGRVGPGGFAPHGAGQRHLWLLYQGPGGNPPPGKRVANRKPVEASRNGFALLTEERRATGHLSGDDDHLQLDHRQRHPVRQISAFEPPHGRGYRLGHPVHPRQDPFKAYPHQEPFGRQPAKGHHRPLASDQAGRAATGRAHTRHRRGRQV